MILSDIQKRFNIDLVSVYPLSEINSIFKILVEERLNFDAAQIVLEAQKEINTADVDYFLQALIKLQENIPIQYILEKTQFYNLKFKVTPKVLIPRPETEELIDWVLKDLKEDNSSKQNIKILDIGTGSGCIAVSLAKNLPDSEVWALDISKSALEIAKYNAQLNLTAINLINLDILQTKTLPQKFDVIVSNPPYVMQQEKKVMHNNVLDHEPDTALFVSDENPLIFYDKITNLALAYLNKSGSLYFEINQSLGKETISLIKSKGFSNILLQKDFLSNDRMIKAIK